MQESNVMVPDDWKVWTTKRNVSQKKEQKIPFYIWGAYGIPEPETEYKFHPVRRWRADYAWPEIKLAVELEGGVWLKDKARHTNPTGFINDMEKYNALAEMGWRLLRYQPDKIDYAQIAKVVNA